RTRLTERVSLRRFAPPARAHLLLSGAGGDCKAADSVVCDSGGMRKALLIVAFLLPLIAAAQDLDRTLMLVATPDLDGAYRHTALIVVPVGEDRHLGFILNRVSPFKLSAIFPDYPPAAKVGAPVYYGGPEMADAIFAIVPGNPGSPSVHLFGE